MRLVIALFTAQVGAFVLHDLPQSLQEHAEKPSWWQAIPSKETVLSSAENAIDDFSNWIHEGLELAQDDLSDSLEDLFFDEEDVLDDVGISGFPDDADRPPHHRRPGRPGRHGPRHGHGHDVSNLTIYEIVSESNYTKTFAKYLAKSDGVIDILNSTDANYTLFVPIDHPKRDEKPAPDHDKPSKEFIEQALQYFIGDGLYSARSLLTTHTLPTVLKETLLGGEPQRLRISFGLVSGLRVNFVAKIIAANIKAKNGFIHAISHVLLPPPVVGRELTLFPSAFSTLLLAYDKTDFVSFVHGVPMNGSTVFAPTNAAFAALGVRANAFLFNTPQGLKYLKALLKYQIVANATLYSDAFYRGEGEEVQAGEHLHVDLPTLLEGKSIAVDIASWAGFVRMRVNGYVPVAVRDGVAKNGVIHVVGRVPLPPRVPPRPGGEPDAETEGEIEVEDLVARLEEYIEDRGQESITDL